MFDILTVVFKEELPILRVQAQSIELYCKDIGIKQIFVIVNDDDLEIDVNWYGSLSSCVKVIPRTQLGTHFHDNGWVSQQYLKLKGSTLSTNTWVMVLDAKTVFIRKIYLKKFFDIFGRIKTGYWKLKPHWKKVEQNINQLFNIKTEGHSKTVPYLFRVDLVKDLIKEVELKTNTPFDVWFQSFDLNAMTEIALYTGYVQSHYGALWKHTSKNRYIRRRILSQHQINDAGRLIDKEFLTLLNQYDQHVIMMHRHVWNALDNERKEKYKNFLIKRGLTSASILK